MISIDPLLTCKFDRDHYHCVHFLIDAGKHLFDYDYSHCFLGLTGSLDNLLEPTKQGMSATNKVDKPNSGTIVLMIALDNKHHVGLYYDGRVLHLPETGVRFDAMRSIKRQYKKVWFYDAKDFS